MSTALNFNLFGNVFHRKQANQRRISDPKIIYDGALCVNRSHFVSQSSSNLDDGGIVELPLYAIIFSFHDKIGSIGEDKDPENSSISHTGTFLFSRCKKYNLLLPLLRNGRSLIYPFVFWRFYKMLFESIHLFWKYSNKL